MGRRVQTTRTGGRDRRQGPQPSGTQKWTLRPVGDGKYELVGADGGWLTSSTRAVVLGVWQCTGDDNRRRRISG
ncbi:hypothetical protein [Kitasatospora sp. NPDC056531]|uniref:hypothetical protein n=1 Tax=Kitasatospora sp. NPDC056531 TaxID=3345856 RepID=UPI0036977ED0